MLMLLVLFLPARVRAQVSAPAASSWDATTESFVLKILPLLAGARDVSMDAKNLSSLSATDVNAIESTVEAKLAERHFSVRKMGTPAGDTSAAIHVTFSETALGYVWIAEISRPSGSGNVSQIALMDFPRSSLDVPHGAKSEVKLERTLIWEQHGPLLDFAVLPSADSSAPELLLLDLDHVSFYRGPASHWQLMQTASIPKVALASPRELAGHFHTQDHSVVFPAGACAVDLRQTQIQECHRQNPALTVKEAEAPLRQNNESAQLSAKCGGRNILLASGSGDWTQPDSIQAFEFDASPRDAAATDAALEFDGPVISLQADDAGARAIVRDLNTGHYEGFLVTAICNN